jgi:hypothetical protein
VQVAAVLVAVEVAADGQLGILAGAVDVVGQKGVYWVGVGFAVDFKGGGGAFGAAAVARGGGRGSRVLVLVQAFAVVFLVLLRLEFIDTWNTV